MPRLAAPRPIRAPWRGRIFLLACCLILAACTPPDARREGATERTERTRSDASPGAPSTSRPQDPRARRPTDASVARETGRDPADLERPIDADALAAIRAAASAEPLLAQPAIAIEAGRDPSAIVLEARRAVDAEDPQRARQLLEALARQGFDDGRVRAGGAVVAEAGETAAGTAAPAISDSDPPDDEGRGAYPLLEQVLPALPPAGRYVYGLALESSGQHGAAAEAFARYGEALPVMADVAWMAVGNARFAAGQSRAAAEAFTRARDLSSEAGSAFLAALRLGNARLRAGEVAAALAAYGDAEQRATAPEQRSQALAGQIAALLEDGDRPAAMATRRRLVGELPDTALAAAALARLKEAGETVDPAEEAAVLAGQGETWSALALLEEAIDARLASGVELPAGWRLSQAGWYAAVGEHARAIEVAEAFLRERPGDPLAPELAWQRARSLDRSGRDGEAVEAYLLVAETWPDSDHAAEALWLRAWTQAAIDGPRTGAQAFALLAERFPGSRRAAEARFQAGLALWQLDDDAGASAYWTALEQSSAAAAERARAAYWLGRQAWDAGAASAARERWQAARDLDPDGFYGLRAFARLEGDEALLLAPPVSSERGDRDADLSAWLAAWTSSSGPAAARAALTDRREVQRMQAWLAIGEPAAARRDGRRALSALARDPAGLAALAEHASGLALHDLAISAASGALLIAPSDQRLDAPSWLERLAYPAPQEDALLAEASRAGVPPSLLLALVRQESRFDPGARSPAGALGLTQVMPATGRQIAVWLDQPGFAPADLLEPMTALRFGATYLEAQLDRFDGRAWPALAAYNGGPGNAERWWAAAGGDIDRFAEIIDFSETRSYVRLVAEHRAHYRRLYAGLE